MITEHSTWEGSEEGVLRRRWRVDVLCRVCFQMLAQKSGNIINMSSVASSIKGGNYLL